MRSPENIFVISAFIVLGCLYGMTHLGFFGWESYLWAGAVDNIFSLPDLYFGLHPGRTRLPDVVDYYHPNHPLIHLLVTGISRFSAGFTSWTALSIWCTVNKVFGFLLLVTVYRICRLLGVPRAGAVMSSMIVGTSDVYWLESVSADAHIASVSTAAYAVFLTLRQFRDETYQTWRTWALLSFVYSAAVGLHLNSAISVAFLSLWLISHFSISGRSVKEPVFAIAAAFALTIAIYVVPFIGHINFLSWESISQTYLLNPAHHGSRTDEWSLLVLGYPWSPTKIGISHFAQAMIPGYSTGSALLQVCVVGAMATSIVIGLFKKSIRSKIGGMMTLVLVFQIWISHVLNSPTTANYWLHNLWIFEIAAVAVLFLCLPKVAAIGFSSVWLIVIALSVYVGEIKPKTDVEPSDLVYSQSIIQELSQYEIVVVSIWKPKIMLNEVVALKKHLSEGQLITSFTGYKNRGSTSFLNTPMLDSAIAKNSIAVVSSYLNDPLIEYFNNEPCWETTFGYQKEEHIPTDIFTFSVDWGLARRKTLSKKLVVRGYRYESKNPACNRNSLSGLQ